MLDKCAPSDGLLQSQQSVTHGLMLSEQNNTLKMGHKVRKKLKKEKIVR